MIEKNKQPEDAQFEKLIRLASQGVEEQDLKRKWSEKLANEYGVSRSAPSARSKKTLVIISVIVLLALVMGLWKIVFSVDQNPVMYAENALQEWQVENVQLRGEEHLPTEALEEARDAVGEGDYKTALARFSEIAIDDLDSGDLYYLAVANFKNGMYKQASAVFEKILQSDGLYTEEARWLQSLVQIKLGNNVKASQLLQYIVDHEQYKNEAAKELGIKIKKERND